MAVSQAQLPDDQRVQAGLAVGGALIAGVGAGAGLTEFTDIGGREGVTTEVGGAVTGVGAPLALRRTVDVRPDGTPRTLVGEPGTLVGRVWRPSAAWGIIGGGLTGLAHVADDMLDLGLLPDDVSDFFMWHAITGVPTGVGMAAFPEEGAGGAGTARTSGRTLREVSGGGAPDGGAPARP